MWQYEYAVDENPKRKHHWDQAQAGFVVINGMRIAKCPKGLSLREARELLNTGLPWSPKRWRNAYPKRIYNIRAGVVYRATPTVPGTSYHGFPEDPGELPPEMKEPLLDLARHQGCLREVKKWLAD